MPWFPPHITEREAGESRSVALISYLAPQYVFLQKTGSSRGASPYRQYVVLASWRAMASDHAARLSTSFFSIPLRRRIWAGG
jgi:hypothetical protein